MKEDTCSNHVELFHGKADDNKPNNLLLCNNPIGQGSFLKKISFDCILDRFTDICADFMVILILTN